ncbi:MAG: hypothetical protein K6F77_00395, partial [Lachnospiraceae bacterium]|nr:hypothetical protein [Lachnospiraceae bacterium]
LAEDIKSIIKAIDVRYSPNEILINLGNLSSNLLELFLILDKIYIPGSVDNKDFQMKKEKFVLFLSKEFGEVIVEKLEFI